MRREDQQNLVRLFGLIEEVVSTSLTTEHLDRSAMRLNLSGWNSRDRLSLVRLAYLSLAVMHGLLEVLDERATDLTHRNGSDSHGIPDQDDEQRMSSRLLVCLGELVSLLRQTLVAELRGSTRQDVEALFEQVSLLSPVDLVGLVSVGGLVTSAIGLVLLTLEDVEADHE